MCEFSTAINRPVYEISKRLRLLKKFGFVAASREGKYNYYRVEEIKGTFKIRVVESILSLREDEFEEDIKRFRKEVCSVSK